VLFFIYYIIFFNFCVIFFMLTDDVNADNPLLGQRYDQLILRDGLVSRLSLKEGTVVQVHESGRVHLYALCSVLQEVSGIVKGLVYGM
jgi:hypothetical protein